MNFALIMFQEIKSNTIQFHVIFFHINNEQEQVATRVKMTLMSEKYKYLQVHVPLLLPVILAR